jgi:hypothetical protein
LIDALHAPLWLVALAAAVAAPFCVGLIQAALESKARRTTESYLTRARALSSVEGLGRAEEPSGRIAEDPNR